MGTNYYITCKCCKSELVHLGKQPYGWSFASNFSKSQLLKKINNLEKNEKICDDGDQCYSKEDFLNEIILDDSFINPDKRKGLRVIKGEFS